MRLPSINFHEFNPLAEGYHAHHAYPVLFQTLPKAIDPLKLFKLTR